MGRVSFHIMNINGANENKTVFDFPFQPYCFRKEQPAYSYIILALEKKTFYGVADILHITTQGNYNHINP